MQAREEKFTSITIFQLVDRIEKNFKDNKLDEIAISFKIEVYKNKEFHSDALPKQLELILITIDSIKQEKYKSKSPKAISLLNYWSKKVGEIKAATEKYFAQNSVSYLQTIEKLKIELAKKQVGSEVDVKGQAEEFYAVFNLLKKPDFDKKQFWLYFNFLLNCYGKENTFLNKFENELNAFRELINDQAPDSFPGYGNYLIWLFLNNTAAFRGELAIPNDSNIFPQIRLSVVNKLDLILAKKKSKILEEEDIRAACNLSPISMQIGGTASKELLDLLIDMDLTPRVLTNLILEYLNPVNDLKYTALTFFRSQPAVAAILGRSYQEEVLKKEPFKEIEASKDKSSCGIM